ncbi:hypothetical protein SBA2_320015 [Acidobacteriia bacterium SbA2]|nr:hypothetical protein SBA2_320015 [Acidobacteriia bacterium SbA2]
MMIRLISSRRRRLPLGEQVGSAVGTWPLRPGDLATNRHFIECYSRRRPIAYLPTCPSAYCPLGGEERWRETGRALPCWVRGPWVAILVECWRAPARW